MVNKLKKAIKNPKLILQYLIAKEWIARLFSDEAYTRFKFRLIMGRKLDLDNPQTFNEKLQWLKLYGRKIEYTTMVDKFAVREYIKEKLGEEYLIPLIGVWDSVDEIDFDSLPEQFVLKCTHDSGGLIICKDKSKLNIKETKKKLKKSLRRDYFITSREWPYKNVKRKIIAEKYMQDGDNDFLPVYKFFCFNDAPKIIQTIQNDKQPNESIDYFDTDWNLINLRQNYPNSEIPTQKPEKLNEMVETVKKLSNGMPFIRVDLYSINGKIYFSEFTFYSDAGFAKFHPEKWDYTLGEWIKIEEKMFGGGNK